MTFPICQQKSERERQMFYTEDQTDRPLRVTGWTPHVINK